MAKVTQGASKRGEAKAREISAVPNSPENLASIAKSANSDGQKYQYAVQLAKQDLGGDTSDDAEFRNLVDSYYEQMDPETSAEDMRGETMVTQAIRGVGEAYDQVNDTLGDGIDWLWDNTAGNVAGLFGGIADLFTGGQTDFGDEWRQGVSDWVSPETADAIASMGTGMLVSAIPGVGVPLSIGLTAAQNSDDLYEALSGRDAVSLEELDANQRLGRFGSAVLDTALAAAPAVGKTARHIKGTNAIDAAEGVGKSVKKAAIKNASKNKGVKEATENLLKEQEVLNKMKLDPQTIDDIGDETYQMYLDSVIAPQNENIAAAQKALDKASVSAARAPARNYGRNLSRYMAGNDDALPRETLEAIGERMARPGTGGSAKAPRPMEIIRNLGRRTNGAFNPVNQARIAKLRVTNPAEYAKAARGVNLADAATAASRAKAARVAGSASGAASEAAGKAAKGGIKEAAKGIGGRAAKGLGGAATSLVRNVGAGAGLNYLNYMGQTGDSNFVNWGGQVAQNPSNWMIAFAPKVARAMPGSSKVFGKLGLTGPSGTGRATSVAQRGIGNNVQSAYDPGLSDEEIRRRILWSEGR